MTTAGWAGVWWWWLLFVAVSWAGLEGLSLVVAHARGRKHIQDWTLSDTIRRWSSTQRWLAPLVVGTSVGLLWHFFGMAN